MEKMKSKIGKYKFGLFTDIWFVKIVFLLLILPQQANTQLSVTIRDQSESKEAAIQIQGAGAVSGGTVLGGLMLSTYMTSQNMFTPHENNCGDDAWVPIYSGSTIGFCIERDERTALNWLDAMRTCLQAGKRLPEPAEWQLSCYHAGTLGLSNMTNEFEWVSNFSQLYNMVDAENSQNYSPVKIAVPIMGKGSCKNSSLGFISTIDNTYDVLSYRCVH